MTETLACNTYNDFGRVVANDRSGTAGDVSYNYDNLHGWLTAVFGCNGRYGQD